MVRLLLDTHIWLWGVEDPKQLSAGVQQAMEAANHEVWLSPVSIWELDLLIRKKRYITDLRVGEWVRRFRQFTSWRDAPITAEVALENARMEMSHTDPADRWLVATARVYDLTLVTADKRLIGLKACSILANRRVG